MRCKRRNIFTSVSQSVASSLCCFWIASSDCDAALWLPGSCLWKKWRTSARCFVCGRRVVCTLSTCRRNVACCAGVSGTLPSLLLFATAKKSVFTFQQCNKPMISTLMPWHYWIKNWMKNCMLVILALSIQTVDCNVCKQSIPRNSASREAAVTF